MREKSVKNKTVQKIFQKKRARRSQLARLPFEKKIEILVELQKMAGGIGKNSRKPVWPI
jgi:hypothetical protein